MAVNPDGTPTYFNISQPVYNQCLAVMNSAQAAWIQMVAEFGAENLATGISANPAAITAIGLALSQVAQYGSQGSLWTAYEALGQVVCTPAMEPWLTPARIAWMQNKLISVIAGL
jgi:hypothetical protein